MDDLVSAPENDTNPTGREDGSYPSKGSRDPEPELVKTVVKLISGSLASYDRWIEPWAR